MRQLIITADDFGGSAGINRAVEDCFRGGCLTAAALMVNGAAAGDAARRARQLTGLELGVHMVLTEEAPVSAPSEVPSLVGRDGRFFLRGELIRRLLLGRIKGEEVLREWEAQIAKFHELGLPLSFLNSHQHVHVLPVLAQAAVRLAGKFGVALRVPRERLYIRGDYLRQAAYCGMVKWPMNALAWSLKKKALESEVASSAHFVSLHGVRPVRFHKDNLLWLLDRIPPGVTELMVHPAYEDAGVRLLWHGDGRLAADRERETRILLDGEVGGMIRDRFRLRGFRCPAAA